MHHNIVLHYFTDVPACRYDTSICSTVFIFILFNIFWKRVFINHFFLVFWYKEINKQQKPNRNPNGPDKQQSPLFYLIFSLFISWRSIKSINAILLLAQHNSQVTTLHPFLNIYTLQLPFVHISASDGWCWGNLIYFSLNRIINYIFWYLARKNLQNIYYIAGSDKETCSCNILYLVTKDYIPSVYKVYTWEHSIIDDK